MTHHHAIEGLSVDLAELDKRAQIKRRSLSWHESMAILPMVGCGIGSSGGSNSTSTSTTNLVVANSNVDLSNSLNTTSCAAIPTETAGPFPANGSSSSVSNSLSTAGIQRSNITSSFAGATGVAAGVPLTVTLQLKNSNNSCAGLAGYAVYLWHCDALGRYSLYSSGVTAENYLRGLQVSDSTGQVSFTTIVPGCYSGRWPHIHFEIFSTLTSATLGRNAVKTSQLALPQSVASAVYAGSGYAGSSSNLAQSSLTSDNVFSDGSSLQVATVTGSNSTGYQATLVVGLNA